MSREPAGPGPLLPDPEPARKGGSTGGPQPPVEGPHIAETERAYVDPVQVHEMWQATCDSCGWHTPPTSPKPVVREWARLHRVTCPLKPAHLDGSPDA